MTVDNIQCLIVIWTFVVYTCSCILCYNIPMMISGTRYAPLALQSLSRQVPAASCEPCLKQKLAGPDINVNEKNYLPLLPGHLRKPLLHNQNLIKLAPINPPLHKTLLPNNQMLQSLPGPPLVGVRQLNPNMLQLLGSPQPIVSLNPAPAVQNIVMNKILPIKTATTGSVATFSAVNNKVKSTTPSDQWFTVTPSTKHATTMNIIQHTTRTPNTKTTKTTRKPTESDSQEFRLEIVKKYNFPPSSIGIRAVTETSKESTMLRVTEENNSILSLMNDSDYRRPDTAFQEQLQQALDQLGRKLYLASFTKLTSISPPDRRENGISFVVSSLFLYLILTALSTKVDNATKTEIDKQLALPASDTDRIHIIRQVLDILPQSSEELKFRWSSRLVVNDTSYFETDATKALHMHVDTIDPAENPENLVKALNRMIEEDSGGAMRDTFEEEELSEGARAILLNTVYLRARWRASPTLLNDSRPFLDAEAAPARTTRMIRINDLMGYAHFPQWDAEAIEISYSTPGLSLLVLVPRGRSLRVLAAQSAGVSLQQVTSQMRPRRVAATLPIYTLRMTLLLPNKLEAMNITRLVDPKQKNDHDLSLSHAVQRLMFWAEAGRNAYKDDGIEWDDAPELELVVDRPYLFFVRWRNLTLMNGNFVL